MTGPTAAICCPVCATPLSPIALPPKPAPAYAYEDCLRRCDACGVGYSNVAKNPTRIYRNPTDNIPPEARDDVKVALDQSLNRQSRTTKWRRLGFFTSEDAVTWVVFSFLALRAPSALAGLGQRLFDFPSAGEPTVLLWGAPVQAGAAASELRDRLVRILDRIGEDEQRRSEPDVVLDYGSSGVALIEVKLHAANDEASPAEAPKFDKYLAKTAAFSDQIKTKASRMYELTRNWRIGWDLADQHSFRLINLGPPSLFSKTERLDLFEKSLALAVDRRFLRITWTSLLHSVEVDLGALPRWLEDWLDQRGLSARGAVKS